MYVFLVMDLVDNLGRLVLVGSVYFSGVRFVA